MLGCWRRRELDEALGLTEMGADVLTDLRQGSNKRHQLVPLLRQSIYSRLAGYEDVNDADRLCASAAMRYVVGGSASLPEKQAASASEVGRLETDTLSQRHNLTALMSLSGQWIDKVHQRQPLKQLILDMDSSVSETYGDQEGTAYKGHFECTCYHPLREKLVKTGAKVVRHAKYVTFQLAEEAVRCDPRPDRTAGDPSAWCRCVA